MKENKAKLFMGIMFKDEEVYKECLPMLKKKFGPLEKIELVYDFDFTDYYEGEMGKNLKKRFIAFTKLINMASLPNIKLFTNKIEDKFRVNKKRRINLDPGYINKNQLVLASMKARSNKVYLNCGVYADLNLVFRKNDAIEFPYTFPDFRDEKVKKFFLKVREILGSG